MKKKILNVALLVSTVSLKKEMLSPIRVSTGILLLIIIYYISILIIKNFDDGTNNISLLFILIPDWKDSDFFKLLNKKYPFLFNNQVKLIEYPKRKGNLKYNRKSRSKNVSLIETYTKSKYRNYILTFNNTPNLQSEALFISVFKEMKKFLNTIKFGNNKSIIAQTIINGKTYSLHKNVKINNKTKPLDYWNLIKFNIETNYDKDYLIEVYPVIKLIIYNLDDKRNKNIIIHKDKSNLTFNEKYNFVMSVVKDIKNQKRRFSSYITPLKRDMKFNQFIVFNKDMLSNLSNLNIHKIFVHDLDNSIFKFIHNYLLDNFDHDLIEVIQDKNNHYIYIKIFRLKFINSYRIFPITEQELINLFKGKNLYEALYNAQTIYFYKYNVDITTVVSTGSLAFKLFRINFLNKNMSIPILSKSLDGIIRESYFGGGVHVFKSYARKVYHYDINSLYPYAMLKPMPFKHLNTFIPNTKFKLKDFFGFIKVEVTISYNCKRILLPHRIDDKISYSNGTFIGVYFSEEIKLYLDNNNYKFKYLEAYEFNKFYPFKNYVDTFYEIKAHSLGIDRFISKLLLNNLYGFLGRSYRLIKTLKINNDQLNKFLAASEDTVINIEKINNYSLIKLIEVNDNYQIKSNVAISSAITSYARIVMHPFLLLNSVIYSDTDSIFSIVPLNPELISKAIGKFKDEMNGIIIEEFISLGPKRYGYWFFDINNQRIERSVYAGLERNSITWKQFVKLNKGK